MSKIKLSLQNLSITEKIEFARQTITAMTGNANFPTPNPALAGITTAINAFETAYNDAENTRNIAKSKTAIQHQKEKDLDNLLTQLANYVENTTNGDEAKIKSAGMQPKSKPSAIGSLTKVMSLHASAGDFETEVDLSWDAIKGAKSYSIELCKDPIEDAKWTHCLIATSSKATIENLEPKLRYWFRVAAVGSAGQGPFSDPATKIVG